MKSFNSMNRRSFLTTSGIGLGAVCGIGETLRAASQSAYPERDRYGGWTGKTFEATGFFRTQHDVERWWLVTPEGNAFISFGVNHYHASFWTQDYNRDFWVRKWGAQRPYDDAWRKGFAASAFQDLRRLGLNTLGIHTDARMLTEPPGTAKFPYVRRYEPLVLSHYRKPSPETCADVFSPDYEATCDAAARKMAAPYADDPMVLGYCMADIRDVIPLWRLRPTFHPRGHS